MRFLILKFLNLPFLRQLVCFELVIVGLAWAYPCVMLNSNYYFCSFKFSSANNLRTFQECCSKVFQIPISFHFDSNKFARLDIMWKVLKFLAELSRRSEALTGVLCVLCYFLFIFKNIILKGYIHAIQPCNR